jgi:hypothetical protein
LADARTLLGIERSIILWSRKEFVSLKARGHL